MTRNRFGPHTLACLLSLAMASTAFAQTDSEKVAFKSEIHDSADLFQAETKKKAEEELKDLERKYKVATRIETETSVNAGTIAGVALERVRQSKFTGIYILIDKDDRKFEMVVTPEFRSAISRTARTTVRDAFLSAFKVGKYDDGLTKGIGEIKSSLVDTNFGIDRPHVERDPIPTSADAEGLVVRQQTRLALPGARLIIEGAHAKAAEMKVKMNIAVVDDGGHLLSFDRMDGARPASVYTAITKATSAATYRTESGPLPKGGVPDVLLNLSLQDAAAVGGGKITTLLGGIPVIVDGQVIGAVGVGGGSGEQDAEVAKAGVAKFQSAIDTK